MAGTANQWFPYSKWPKCWLASGIHDFGPWFLTKNSWPKLTILAPSQGLGGCLQGNEKSTEDFVWRWWIFLEDDTFATIWDKLSSKVGVVFAWWCSCSSSQTRPPEPRPLMACIMCCSQCWLHTYHRPSLRNRHNQSVGAVRFMLPFRNDAG